MLLAVTNVGSVEIATDTLIRVTRIHHHHISVLLYQLAHHGVGRKALSASRWPQTEEVRVICQFQLSLLSGKVNGYRYTLSVGIIHLQRSHLVMLHALLIEETQGRVLQSQEQIIVLIEAVRITWEGARKQLQLVIGRLRRGDAHLKELRFQIASHLRQVLLLTGHKNIEVRPDHRLLFGGNNLQHLVNVGLGNLVAGVWHRGMALRLSNQPLTLPALLGYLYHLVINHTVCQGHRGEERQQIGTHGITVDGLGLHRVNNRRQVDDVYINQRKALYHSVAHL